MNTSVSKSWLLNGYFNLRGQDPTITQEIRGALCSALSVPKIEMGRYPVGTNWKHVFWWRETKTDFAEAQFVAAISDEYPVLSLGVSVEKGRGTATKNRPALDRTWDWHNLLKQLPKLIKADVAHVADGLGQPLNLRIKSKPSVTPDTAGWKTRGFSFVDRRWFERHVGAVKGDEIADYIRELHGKKDSWVIVTFTRDLSPSEADGMSAAAVTDVLLKFNPLRERLRGRRSSVSGSSAKSL